jgi:hypothetical protein
MSSGLLPNPRWSGKAKESYFYYFSEIFDFDLE